MKFAVAIAIAGTGLGQAASVWNAGDGQWFDAANWDNGVPSSEDATISNGSTVTYTPGGDQTIDSGSTLIVSNGSTLTQTEQAWMRINGNATFVLNNGGYSRTGGGNIVTGFDASESGNIIATNSSITTTGGMRMGYGANAISDVSLTNSSLLASSELWFGNPDNVINGQNAILTLDNSTVSADKIWFWNPESTIFNLNMIGVSSVTTNVGTSSNADYTARTWEGLYDDGILTYNGSNADPFSDHFTTSGNVGEASYTLTTVPEPSTTAFGALALLGLCAVRRRRASK